MKQDVYESITNRIVAELEQGTRPWLKTCPKTILVKNERERITHGQ